MISLRFVHFFFFCVFVLKIDWKLGFSNFFFFAVLFFVFDLYVCCIARINSFLSMFDLSFFFFWP